jgi:uncharacterized protein DUF3617
MRHFLLGAVLGAALMPGAPLHAATDGVPARKPGYWEITTVAPVSGMTKTKVCIGADDDIVRPEGGDCTEPKLTPLNEGVIVDVVCTTKDGKQTISTTFTGDFDTRYHAILKTTFDPPLGAIRHMGVNIDGKYLGPDCPEDAQ